MERIQDKESVFKCGESESDCDAINHGIDRFIEDFSVKSYYRYCAEFQYFFNTSPYCITQCGIAYDILNDFLQDYSDDDCNASSYESQSDYVSRLRMEIVFFEP